MQSEDSKKYKYDVFISYSHEDAAWVTGELKERLEKKFKLSVCIDDYDFTLGKFILRNIRDAINESRKVLLVLTPSYIASGWCKHEAIRTCTHDPANEAPKMIPLKKKECDLESIGLDLYTFVDFTNVADQEIAWNRLAVALDIPSIVAHSAFVSSEYPPWVVGGLGVHVHELASELVKHCKVSIILPSCSDGSYEDLNTDIKLRQIEKCHASYSDPTSWIEFARDVVGEIELMIEKGERPEVIHCHDWVTVLGGIACRWKYKIPLVYHVHLPDKRPLSAKIDHLGRACADLLLVSSKFMHDEMRVPVLPIKKIRILKNGVNTQNFTKSEIWPEDGNYILFVGRLVKQKGVVYLLRAFRCLTQKFPEIRLVIVGMDPSETYSSELKRLTENLLISKKVDFLGEKKGIDLQRLYQDCRILVVPSIYEPFGMTVIEGMASARPVIASNLGGLKDLIVHGENGYLFAPKNHLDLAQWIMALLGNDTRRKDFGERGLNIAKSDYQWSTIASDVMVFYQEISHADIDLNPPPIVHEICNELIMHAKSADDRYNSENKIWNLLFPWREGGL